MQSTRRLSLKILDTLPQRDFDQIAFLASQVCGTPIALILLVDGNRRCFKSTLGIAASEIPLVIEAPFAQFYAEAPILSLDGEPIGIVGVIDTKPRSLTAGQVEALTALSEQITRLLKLRSQIVAFKKNEKQLLFKNKAIETICEGVVRQDSKGTIIDFNPAALQVLNLSADQLLGKTSMDPSWRAIKQDGSDFPGNEHPAMVCLQSGKSQKNVIMGIQNSFHEIRWLKINSVPETFTAENSPAHVVTSFVDISEEVVAKNLLEKKSADLRFVLDGIPHMVGLWGADEINLQANSIYSEYFIETPEQIKGCSLRHLLGEELYMKNQPFVKRALSGEKVSFERNLTHIDGSLRNVLATYIPNFKENKVVSFLAVIVDITNFRKLETEQRRLGAQLAKSAKLSALGEMAAGVAHEVNNPLTIIKGKSKILILKAKERTLDLDSVLNDLMVIESTADRIAKIVNAMGTYTRDAGNDSYQEASLLEIINDTLEICNKRFSNANVEILMSCEPNIKISCKPAQISQVIMNLLNNSFDAISDLETKWIEIKALKKDDCIELQVIDSGTGIADSIAEKIMNPFFTTKEVGKGTGLGLSISTGIIEAHGGKISYCEESINTTFLITFPVCA